MPDRLLIVEPDTALRAEIGTTVESLGCEVSECPSLEPVHDLLVRSPVGCVIVAHDVEAGSGLAFARELRTQHADLEVLVTYRGSDFWASVTLDDLTNLAFSPKPDVQHLVATVARVLGRRRLRLRNHALLVELGRANADLTEALGQLRTAHAQLLQSEKLAALGHLVAGVAHELNNPLTSIVGYAQLVREELAHEARWQSESDEAGGQLSRDLLRISEESERAASIVRNLLAFARQQPTERHLHRVADLVDRALSLRQDELRLHRVAVQVDCPAGLPPVLGDATQLQQTLVNLIANADQAMVGRTATPRLEIACRSHEAADAVQVLVTDNGPGMDDADLAKVFDPFFTTKPVGQGVGLGLSICYGVIRDHGGHIRVESEPGVGTTFVLELPARVDGAGVRGAVLLAHADAQERRFLSAMLTGWGHHVLAPEEPRAALAEFTRGRGEVVLVDRSVCRELADDWERALRSSGEGRRIIFLDAAGAVDQVGRLSREFGAAVLSPPYPLEAVLTAITAAIPEVR
jgi:two-component system NtrC family sensor kinase